jgi:hypothetical protein
MLLYESFNTARQCLLIRFGCRLWLDWCHTCLDRRAENRRQKTWLPRPGNMGQFVGQHAKSLRIVFGMASTKHNRITNCQGICLCMGGKYIGKHAAQKRNISRIDAGQWMQEAPRALREWFAAEISRSQCFQVWR